MAKEKRIKLMIITGISGAGKSAALKFFEDQGYYSIDNLPSQMLINLIDFFSTSEDKINKVAVAVDLRSGYLFEEIFRVLEDLRSRKNITLKIIFLEASKNILMKRYSLTRRKHPLVEDGDIAKGILKEEKEMYRLRELADEIIDTSNLNPKELRLEITERIMGKKERSKLLNITVISFGYKFGMPPNVDIVMDVRFLPNPYYDHELRDLNGKDKKIIDYVVLQEETKIFLRKFEDMLDFLIPYYISEGKHYLGIGIGCTGGRHRSVVISDRIAYYLRLKGYPVKLINKDISKQE
jgi:UPF0042 nucleotide-binding protein